MIIKFHNLQNNTIDLLLKLKKNKKEFFLYSYKPCKRIYIYIIEVMKIENN